MGFAKKDPGMLSVDITLSPTFAIASSSGTSGCKDWDYTAELRRDFVRTQWALILEESSRGAGGHLAAFSEIMGCFGEDLPEFKRMLRMNYQGLFPESSPALPQYAERFLWRVEGIVKGNRNLNCSG